MSEKKDILRDWRLVGRYWVRRSDGYCVPVIQGGGPANTVQNDRYAFGDDDGSESAHSLDTENTNRTAQIADVTFMIRIQVEETAGGTESKGYALFAQKNGTGGFTEVTTARADGLIIADDTQSRADDENTTERLTAGAGTFQAGKYDDGQTQQGTTSFSLDTEYTDLEFAIQIDSANASDADYWELRAEFSDGTDLDGYPGSYPTVTASIALSIDKTDGVTVGESVTVRLESHIVESDGVTVGEAVTVYNSRDITVSDGLTVGESVTVDVSDPQIQVSDGLTVGEAVTVDVSDPQITKSDSVPVSDDKWAIEFDGTDTLVNCGSDTSLDDLHDTEFTVEAWFRPDGYGQSNLGWLASKGGTDAGVSAGWLIRITDYTGMDCYVSCDTSYARENTGAGTISDDGEWHHIVMYFNDAGDRKVKVALDGTWYVNIDTAGQGAIDTDAGTDLVFGNRSDNAAYAWDGGIAWVRISDNDRYGAGTDFTPPPLVSPPSTDGNTVEQWNFQDGSGTTAAAEVSSPTNDGSITFGDGDWVRAAGPTVRVLSFISETDNITLGESVTVYMSRDISVSDNITIGDVDNVGIEGGDLDVNVSDGLTVGEFTNGVYYFPFFDGFESGDIREWDSENGTVVINGTAAMQGSYGMECDPTSYDYVKFGWSTDIQEVRTSFYFNKNNVAGDANDRGTLVQLWRDSGTQDVGYLEYINIAGTHRLRIIIRNDVGGWEGYQTWDVTAGDHLVEVQWLYQNSIGHVAIWVDGELQAYEGGFDTGSYGVDEVRFGSISGLGGDDWNSGTYYLDHFTLYDDLLPIVDVSDNVTVGESVTVSVSDPQVDVSDGVTVGESVSTQHVLLINVSDGITVGETIDVHRQAAWYHPDSITVIVGSVDSGDIEDTWSDNNQRLILNETTGTPGFDYEFDFYDVPVLAHSIALNGYYQGNPGHAIKIQQYNFTATGWTNLSPDSDDFPTDTSDQDYEFAIFNDGDYNDGGNIRIKIVHNTGGSTAHDFYIDLMQLGTHLAVHVNSDMTVGESVTVYTARDISETDNITVGEAISVEKVLTIAVSDGLTINEATTVYTPRDIAVSDGLAVGEDATVAFEVIGDLDINVSDGITVGESVDAVPAFAISVSDNITIAELPRYYSDDITIGEYVELLVYLVGVYEVSVSDNITVGESVTVDVSDPQITVSDGITVGEAVTVYVSRDIDVSDNVTVGESVVVYTPRDITVSDNVVIGEDTTVEARRDIDVSDNVTVGENVTVDVSDPQITVSDNIVVGDNTNVVLPEPGAITVVVDDNITVGESVTVDVSDPQITVSDGLVVGESVQVNTTYSINVTDNITVGEDTTVTVSNPQIVVSDGITVGESVNATLVDNVSVTDNVALGETTTVDVSDPNIQVSDNINLGENTQVVAPEAGAITVVTLDSIVIGESVTVSVSDPQITVTDSITVGEYVEVEAPRDISVTDNIVVGETTTVFTARDITVSDNVVVGESVNAITSDPQIVVVDGIVVADSPSVSIGVPAGLLISVSDNIVLGETTSLAPLLLDIAVSDTIVVGEAVNVTFVAGLFEVLFKGMERAVARKMR